MNKKNKDTQVAKELFERSLSHIDFDGIRTLLSNHATSSMSKKSALEITPSTDPLIVEELLEETYEGRLLINDTNTPNLYGLEDISELIMRTKLGGILNGLESLHIASSIEILTDFKKSIDNSMHPLMKLKKYTAGIADLTEISNSIKSKVNPDGSIKDSATPELKSIRNQISKNYNNVVRKLSRIINSSDLEDAIQDNVISVRGDRLVIQVKTNMQHKIPGVIHGASNTGLTQFIEPLETIDLCNAWRKSALEEELEIMRILTEISNSISTYSDQLTSNIEIILKLDLIISKSKLSNSIKSNIEIFSDSNRVDHINLISVFHPLLGQTPKPLNLTLSKHQKILIITGPNTGGKTVALKTVGLLAAMQQSGIHITGKLGTYIPIFDGIYADIGDQQSIEGSVSTFSSHIENLKSIIEIATPKSLVLLDEIGSSTDPEEGAAIGSAILEYFASQNITTLATTHHSSIVITAENNPLMKNASFHLDPDTLFPTYELQEGISGRSYALSIASNLGLPDKIVKKAIQNLSPEAREMNSQLEGINRDRKNLTKALEESKKHSHDYKLARERLESELQYILIHRDQILTEITSKAKEQFQYLKDLISRAKSVLSWSSTGVSSDNFDEKKDELSKISDRINDLKPPEIPILNSITDFQIGDTVSISDINTSGILLSIDKTNATAIVKVGNSKLKVDKAKISNADKRIPNTSNSSQKYTVRKPIDPGQDILDIRGDDVETALPKIDFFLNAAITNGLSKVTIIHGKGTGILRKSIRQNLSSHTLVGKFEPKLDSSGGDGATTIILV